MNYDDFLKTKDVSIIDSGFDVEVDKLNKYAFDWQRDIVRWAIKKGKAALQKESAREEKDEKHICPLQLTVIRRGITLWSNPGDIVFSPFGGIGSEPYTALENGRRAIACELKTSYYNQMLANCKTAVNAEQGCFW